MIVDGYPTVVFILVAHFSFHPHHLCTFHHTGEISLLIGLADTASHSTALGKRVAYTVAYHAVSALAVSHTFQIITQYGEALPSVEVVRVDHGKGLMDH